MRILILGTSNSILQPGWTSGLRRALPTATIENKSIGASPGIQFSLNFSTTDFSCYEFVFLDSVPNDQTYHDLQLVHHDKESTLLFHKITFEIIKRIATQTRLIVMGIDEQTYFNCNSEFYKNRIAFAQNANAYFVDTTALIKQFAQHNGINLNIIYDYHPSHPDRGIMSVIGQAIGETLPELLDTPFIPISDITPIPFSYWWPTTEYETKQYKNSLVDDIYAILKNNQSIHFSVPQTPIGFYINISKTNCIIDLLIKGHHVFSIALNYPLTNNLVKIFVPIPKILQIDEIRVRSVTNLEVDYHTLGSRQDNYGDQETILTISSFIFCDINLLDPHPFLFQTSTTSNTFNAEALQNLLRQTFATHQHNKKIFLIKPNTGNDFLEKSNFFNQNVTSQKKRIAIFTYYERILCYNVQNKSIQSLPLEEIDQPNIYLLNVEFSEIRKIRFFINLLNNIFYVDPFNENDIPISYECHYDRILFKKGELILSVNEKHEISTTSKEWGSYELFPLGCIVN